MNKLMILKEFIRVRWFNRFKTREDLEKYQQKILARQLSFIRTNSPYFRKLRFSSVEDLPVMDKQFMMEHFNELNTVGVDRDKALQLVTLTKNLMEYLLDCRLEQVDIEASLSSVTKK